jgi:hypothetical protein
MMRLKADHSRLRELGLIFAMILILFLLSLTAPTDPTPPTPTPWHPGEVITPSPTPTATPAWWQDMPTPFTLYPTPTGDAHVSPNQP